MLHPADFFDLSTPFLAELFADCATIWDILPRLGDHVARLTHNQQTILGEVMPGAYLSDRPLFIGAGARIEPGAYVHGPAYIAPGAVVRHGAFVRENVILLEGSILGHASEAKNSLFFPHAHAPHFNYVGDSILGHHVNLGAGTKLSNLSMLSEKDEATGKRTTISITIASVIHDTGIAKMGAILGEGAQTGCNAVLTPGSLVAPGTMVYANVSLRKGYYPPHSLVKLRQTIEVVAKR